MTSPHQTQILSLHDAGHSVAQVALAVQVSPGYVYGILRTERPDRPRAKRTRTSETPGKVAGLHAAGIKAPRIAFLLGVSSAYVYRILAEREAT